MVVRSIVMLTFRCEKVVFVDAIRTVEARTICVCEVVEAVASTAVVSARPKVRVTLRHEPAVCTDGAEHGRTRGVKPLPAARYWAEELTVVVQLVPEQLV